MYYGYTFNREEFVKDIEEFLNKSVYNFSSDNVNIFKFNIDSSGSMGEYGKDRDVRAGLEMYKKSFMDFPESDSIAISLSKFDSYYHPASFENIREFTIDYDPEGATALHESIVKGGVYLIVYMTRVTRKTGVIPRATYIVFSDGHPCDDRMGPEDSKKIIQELKDAGVTTVFVAFGEAIGSKFGDELGFDSTIEVKEQKELINFLGVELSKSCKEQSQSMKALGSNFFSQAVVNKNSEGYSLRTSAVVDDEDFMDDI